MESSFSLHSLLSQANSRQFSVKLVNPSKKSDYRVEKWHVSKEFASVNDFESELKSKFTMLKGKLTFGYIEPGHGLKGRQHWIVNDSDIIDMYKMYKGKNEVIIWCHLPASSATEKTAKRKNTEASPHTSKRMKCSDKNEKALDEVKAIVSQLQSKHGKNYTPEQYNAWAQLIHIKKHTSLDDCPDFPFFRGNKKTTTTKPSSQSSPAITSLSTSPSKRIHVRSELLNQIAKISDLLQKGYISQERHDKLQKDILEDIDNY